MSSKIKYAKLLSNINTIVTYVNSSLMYCIYYIILYLSLLSILFCLFGYLFCLFFLREISYTATLVNLGK